MPSHLKSSQTVILLTIYISLLMLQDGKQEVQKLNSGAISQAQMDRRVPSSARKEIPSLLKIAIVVLLAFGLYELTGRVFSVSSKQEEMREALKVYNEAVQKLQLRIKTLNNKDPPFTEDEKEEFKQLKKSIKQLENKLLGQQKLDSDKSNQDAGLTHKVQDLEKTVEERDVLIDMIYSHSKEHIRQKKIAMFEKIGKKSEFQEEKIRNPWALSRLNLKTPYIDTYQKHKMEEQLQKEAARLENSYRLSFFTNEIPLCIIVSTHNNAKNYRYEYNLQSILNQDYKNYKIIITDDASDDGTADLIQAFLQRSQVPTSRYVFIRNPKRMTAVPNINRAIRQHCSKEDVAVLISGDDQILGRKVFKILNAVYQSKKPGVAYTNHFFGNLHENDFGKGYSRPYSITEIKNRNYRFIGQNFGHMRTFQVSLFFQIKEDHMKYKDGRWIDATYDETFLMPMLEMACDSIEYIDQYVYVYNYGTGENDGQIHHEIQSEAALYVRQLPRYECIEKYQKFVI